MPPIGANTWIWFSPPAGDRVAEIAPRVAGWGFDLLELPVEEPGQWDPGAVAELLAHHGLGASVCAVMPPGRELVATDPETVARTQAYLRTCVDAAARVGSRVVAGPMYASVGRCWRMDADERARALRELREALAPVCEHAGERGVRLAVEPLNRYETSLLNTVEQTLEAIDGLPPASCGILADVYHLNIEERDPAAALRAAGDRLAHVHACANDRGVPGRDHLDWPAIAAALRETGYAGAVSIESFTAHNESIATAASIWRPLAETQDAIAVEGLAFLRDVLEGTGT
jgi:D-psicose/D-tagatose/L-ribulose 3-epimerase